MKAESRSTHRPTLLALFLALSLAVCAGCSEQPIGDPLFPSTSGSGPREGTVGGTTGVATTGSFNPSGTDSLSGALAFVPQGVTYAAGPSSVRVDFSDGQLACDLSDATHVVELVFPAPSVAVGSYALDGGGATLTVQARDADGGLSLVGTSEDGLVTCTRGGGDGTLSGNFATTLRLTDGGTSALSGIFAASRCD